MYVCYTYSYTSAPVIESMRRCVYRHVCASVLAHVCILSNIVKHRKLSTSVLRIKHHVNMHEHTLKTKHDHLVSGCRYIVCNCIHDMISTAIVQFIMMRWLLSPHTHARCVFRTIIIDKNYIFRENQDIEKLIRNKFYMFEHVSDLYVCVHDYVSMSNIESKWICIRLC